MIAARFARDIPDAYCSAPHFRAGNAPSFRARPAGARLPQSHSRRRAGRPRPYLAIYLLAVRGPEQGWNEATIGLVMTIAALPACWRRHPPVP